MASEASTSPSVDSTDSPETLSVASTGSHAEDATSSSPPKQAPRLPSRYSSGELLAPSTRTSSSTPLGALNAARRPGPLQSSPASARTGALPQDMQAKMKAFHLSRQGAPPPQNLVIPRNLHSKAPQGFPASASPISGALTGSPMLPSPGGASAGGAPGIRLPSAGRPGVPNFNSAPAIPHTSAGPKLSLAAKRGLNKGMKLSDATGPSAEPDIDRKDHANIKNEAPNQDFNRSSESGASNSLFTKYSEFVDTKTGTLRFKGKATIHGKGIDFSSGTSFSISLDEVDNLEELGKGNYGTVYRVRHTRPQMRRPGLGLNGIRQPASQASSSTNLNEPERSDSVSDLTLAGKSTGMVMAMKEIRLELDDAKFAAIIMELDVLHRCISPFIVDFYGAFFQEGAVYICMEYMDGGSIDKLYGDGIPEGVLRKITMSTVMGLKALKDEHNIIHRDVKPTNILVNTNGQVKICDFGVSGNLVASIAKTNIGCQSYMAPERISSGGVAQAGANPGGGTYSVQSDIWSLGLTIVECAVGQYPYPPETYNNIFSQLSAIVDGDPPDLPARGFSDAARDFVRGCLNKIPRLRPTYAMLLRHGWLAPLLKPPPILEEDEGRSATDETKSDVPTTADKEVAQWVCEALERRRSGKMGQKSQPALHAAPLAAVPSPPDDAEVR